MSSADHMTSIRNAFYTSALRFRF